MSRRSPPPAQPDLFDDAAAAVGAGTAPQTAAQPAIPRPPPVTAPKPAPGPRPQEHEDPAEALAAGLAQHMLRWAHLHGADAASAAACAEAAQALSLARSDGHVCLGLDQLPAPGPGEPGWRQRLLASGAVGTPEAPGARPLLLDGEDRLYLQRDHDRECRLARRIAAALAVPPEPLAPGISPAASPGGGNIDAAAVAAAMALRGRLTIVSGGPGTGKTTAVLRLLGLVLAREPQCRIALAAPTGKAAARMAEAIRERAATLPPALRERLPTQATTLHRLLGVSPAARGGPGEGFIHHAGRPLPIDLLVIDEASMLDLALATRVFEAVPPAARIVLLGDQDQLAAVESGAVFAELSGDPGLSEAGLAALALACAVPAEALQPPPPRRATGLRDAVVWFQRNHRFAADSGIGRLARDIRAGDSAQALADLGAGPGGHPVAGAPGDDAVHWFADGGEAVAPATEAALRAPYTAYLDAVRAHLAGRLTAAEVLQQFDRYRVLCALRAGPRGVAGWNVRLDAWARRQLGPAVDAAPRTPWYPGRPVMVLRNDAQTGVFNGDIGIALPAPAGPGLAVWFADAAEGLSAPPGPGCAQPAPRGGQENLGRPCVSLRAVAPLRLPAHDSAWAMTVHQSQGSEFAALGIVMPAQAHRVLSRELLYTAVTRARSAVCLVGSAATLRAAIDTPTQRRSGLASRLREALAATATATATTTTTTNAGLSSPIQSA